MSDSAEAESLIGRIKSGTATPDDLKRAEALGGSLGADVAALRPSGGEVAIGMVSNLAAQATSPYKMDDSELPASVRARAIAKQRDSIEDSQRRLAEALAEHAAAVKKQTEATDKNTEATKSQFGSPSSTAPRAAAGTVPAHSMSQRTGPGQLGHT